MKNIIKPMISLIIYFLIFIVIFMFLSGTHITSKPFSIKFTQLGVGVGFVLLLTGLYLFGWMLYTRGYNSVMIDKPITMLNGFWSIFLSQVLILIGTIFLIDHIHSSGIKYGKQEYERKLDKEFINKLNQLYFNQQDIDWNSQITLQEWIHDEICDDTLKQILGDSTHNKSDAIKKSYGAFIKWLNETPAEELNRMIDDMETDTHQPTISEYFNIVNDNKQ